MTNEELRKALVEVLRLMGEIDTNGCSGEWSGIDSRWKKEVAEFRSTLMPMGPPLPPPTEAEVIKMQEDWKDAINEFLMDNMARSFNKAMFNSLKEAKHG